VAGVTAPLPDAAVLADVFAGLADPNVPGTDKLNLVQGAGADKAAALDAFTKALADSHLPPLTVVAADLTWSSANPGSGAQTNGAQPNGAQTNSAHPNVVRANVTATSAKPGSVPFNFPMEFVPTTDGWQLSRRTADQLLTVPQ